MDTQEQDDTRPKEVHPPKKAECQETDIDTLIMNAGRMDEASIQHIVGRAEEAS